MLNFMNSRNYSHSIHAFILALSFVASLSSMGEAATLDLEDLSIPRPGRSDLGSVGRGGLALPSPSAGLGADAQHEFTQALRMFLSGDFSGSEPLARRLTEVAPEAPETWYLLGMVLANTDRKRSAVEALDRAAALYKSNAAPLIIKGDLLQSLGEVTAAGEAWTAAVARDPQNVDALSRQAGYLEARGDRSAAIRAVEAALGAGAGDQTALRLQAARMYLLDGNAARVEVLLQELSTPENAPSLVLDYLGRAKVGLDKLADGAELFDRLIARAEIARPFIARARIAVAARDLRKASEVLAAGRELFPHDATLLLETGRILGASRDYEAALEALMQGLDASPNSLPLLRAASLAANRSGKAELALDYARRAAVSAGAGADDLLRLAALQERDSPMEAESLYRNVLEKNPDHWIALNNLANLLLKSSPEEALVLAERATLKRPNEPSLRDTLGIAQIAVGKTSEAANTFQILHQEQPEAALPVYRMGQVRLAEGKVSEARNLFQEALLLDPKFIYAEDAQRQLQ